MREVTLYTRKQCGLCEDAAFELRRLSRPLRFDLLEVDVDDDTALRSRFNEKVPVIAVGERVLAAAPIDTSALERLLRDALS